MKEQRSHCILLRTFCQSKCLICAAAAAPFHCNVESFSLERSDREKETFAPDAFSQPCRLSFAPASHSRLQVI